MYQNGVHAAQWAAVTWAAGTSDQLLPLMCAYPYPTGLVPAAVLCCPTSFGRGLFALCWLSVLLTTDTFLSRGSIMQLSLILFFWDNNIRHLLLLLLYVLKHLSAAFLKVAKGIHQVLVFIHHVSAPRLCCKLADCSGCYCQLLGVLILCYRNQSENYVLGSHGGSLLPQCCQCLLSGPGVPALNQMRWVALSGWTAVKRGATKSIHCFLSLVLLSLYGAKSRCCFFWSCHCLEEVTATVAVIQWQVLHLVFLYNFENWECLEALEGGHMRCSIQR